LKAIRNCGSLLQYAGDDHRNDKEIVLEAINTNGCAIEFASFEIRKNKEIVLKAVSNSPFAYVHCIDNELKDDKEVEWVYKRYFKCIRTVLFSKNIAFDIIFKFK